MLNNSMEHFADNMYLYMPGTLITLFVVGNYINFKKSNEGNPAYLLFCFALFMTLLPLLSLVTISFALYRQIVYLILKIKHGTEFGGLLSAYDAIHAIVDAEKNTICVLFIIQYNSKESFYDTVKDEINRKLFCDSKKIPKALSVIRESFGYTYYLKSDITSDDCVKKLKSTNCATEELTKDDLMRVIGEHTSDPLPKDGAALWDVYIGTQAVRWKNNDESTYYPILLRFHHSLADGADMSKAIIKLFGDRHKRNVAKELLPDFRINLGLILNQIYVIWLFPSIVLGQVLRTGSDSNILHGPKLRSRRVLATNVEDSPRYIQAIRRIRSKIPGATVIDVFLTAISASLEEYYKKNSAIIPSYITVSVPEAPKTMQLINIDANKLKNENIHCQNLTTFSLFKLPIHCDDVTNLIDRLRLIQKMGSRFRNQLQLEANHWLKILCFGCLPQPLINLVVPLTKVTAMFTNLPGTPAMTVFGGHLVQDVVPLGYHRERTGVIFITLTYAGRLQMALSVDQSLISKEETVQSILNSVYKYLDVLEEEVCSLEANGAHHAINKTNFADAIRL